VPALLEARRRGEVVVGAECHNDEVGVVGARVGADAARGRVDACHHLLAELDAILLKVAVVQPNVIGRLTAQHHLELGEAEEERVVAIDQRYANRVGDPLREPRRELQSAEPGPEDHDVLAHRQHTTPAPGWPPGPEKGYRRLESQPREHTIQVRRSRVGIPSGRSEQSRVLIALCGR
jgi:hypothetical protein